VTIWAVGDGADGSEASKALARRITSSRPDRFLYLGDVYQDGTPDEFRTNYQSVYGALAPVTSPTPGNHEWPAQRSGYTPYWSAKKGRPQPSWYSFRTAGWQVVSLNSETAHGARSSQVRWLRRAVSGSGDCRIAFWHRPRYSAGTSHGDNADVEPFWRALQGRASIVLNGHEHNLQRFRERRGIQEFVSGAGGHKPHGLRPDARVAFGNDDDRGALRLRLRPGVAEFAFVADDGRVLDSGRVPCRR